MSLEVGMIALDFFFLEVNKFHAYFSSMQATCPNHHILLSIPLKIEVECFVWVIFLYYVHCEI